MPEGYWTSYQTISELIYGHGKAGQAVGSMIRAEACPKTSHRTLRTGGVVSQSWHSGGGGPEECVRRLREEGSWDERGNRARAERFLDAAALARQR